MARNTSYTCPVSCPGADRRGRPHNSSICFGGWPGQARPCLKRVCTGHGASGGVLGSRHRDLEEDRNQMEKGTRYGAMAVSFPVALSSFITLLCTCRPNGFVKVPPAALVAASHLQFGGWWWLACAGSGGSTGVYMVST
ncbi:hypothetical protein V8C26DRAFT_403717 [Trichoderma gracile]